MYGGLHSPRSLPSPSALLDLAREFTPRVEARGPTPVLLDLFGLGRVWPTPQALGQAIHEAAQGRRIEAQVALAWSRATALVLARGRPGLTIVPPGKEAEALAPLPLALLDIEAHPPRDAVQAITVRAEPTPARSVQFSLLDPAQPSPERLAETMARLHSWTAAGRGGAAALLDTHRPGAFAVGTFAPGPVTPRAPA